MTSIDTLRAKDLQSALSLGPSTADAAAGRTQFWDQSLGTSPFRPTARYARTLLALHDNKLHLQILFTADPSPDAAAIDARATAGVEAFLRAYRQG